jgi:predicted nucleotide-binding protein
VADEELERLRSEVERLQAGQNATRSRLLNQFETIARLRLRNDAGRFIKQAQNIQFEVFNPFGPDDAREEATQFEEGRSALLELINSVQYHLDAIERSKKDGSGASIVVSMDSATTERLAKIICGGEGAPDPQYPKYRSSWYLTRFFKDAGLPQYVHDGSTRKQWVINTLDEMTSADLYAVIQRLTLRKDYDTEQEWQRAVDLVNEALEPEGFKVNADPRNPSVEVIGASVMGPSALPQPAAVNKRVFVVYGRNRHVRDAMFQFLRALGLEPIEWEHAVMSTGSGAPYVGTVVEKAIRDAAAVVVLLTPEDEARLLPDFVTDDDADYERNLTPQARPNVIFEAGMAFGVVPERTIVVEFGVTRPFSDFVGRNTVRFEREPSQPSRNALATRLENLGLPVDKRGGDWLTTGVFYPK